MRPPAACLTCPGSNGSIIPPAAMRRIHLSDLMLMLLFSRVLYRNLGHGNRPVLRLQRQLRGGLARDLAITRGDVGIWNRGNGRIAAVGLFPDANVQRQ